MERDYICDICHKNQDDPVELGDIYKKSKLQVHYYCLLLSSYLPQKGEDSGGILGFLVHDIRAEAKNSEKRICQYCNENHASVMCHTCDIFFHVLCGLKNNCLFEFVDEFRSFCGSHHGISHADPHDENKGCYICLQPMGEYNPLTSISPKCCNLNCWVHRRCMKQYALSAGYYLHCLWCKSEDFRNDIRRLGIFVPDRDALWEREKGAFGELYQRYSKCDAGACLCPHGRNYNSRSRWHILVCSTCATAGIHVGCLSERDSEDNYQCTCCIQILKGNPTLIEISITDRTKLDQSQKSRTGSPDRTLYMSKSQPVFNKLEAKSMMLGLSKSLKRGHNEVFQNILPFTKTQIPPNHKISDDGVYFPIVSPLKDSSNLSLQDSNKRRNLNKVVSLRESNEKDGIKKRKFDNNLIHELVEQAKNEQLLNEAIIDLSEDDDSEKSAGQLLQKLTRLSTGNVPKPRLVRNTKNQSREHCMKKMSDSLIMYDVHSSHDSNLYRVSPSDKMIEIEDDDNLERNTEEGENTYTLEEKIKRYFIDYQPGTPPESD